MIGDTREQIAQRIEAVHLFGSSQDRHFCGRPAAVGAGEKNRLPKNGGRIARSAALFDIS
jgi:hypothetical protein